MESTARGVKRRPLCSLWARSTGGGACETLLFNQGKSGCPGDVMADRFAEQWQTRMIPVMVGLVVAAALFFGVTTVYQFASLQAWLTRAPAASPVLQIVAEMRAPAAADPLALAQARAAIALEQELIARRYEEARVVAVARLWTRFMGFLTGMSLALVGAAFVLGQLQTGPIRMSAEQGGLKAALATTSPGLVLAVVGSVLIGVTQAIPYNFRTSDPATYFQPAATVDPAATGRTTDEVAATAP